jgi:hypothetical protein
MRVRPTIRTFTRIPVTSVGAKKRAQDMGVDLGPSFDETVEKARTGKILDEV